MTELIKSWNIDKEIGHLGELSRLVYQGIEAAKGSVELISALEDVDRCRPTYDKERWIKKLKSAKDLSEIAERHVDDGLSYWFSLMTIQMWSIVEAGVQEIAIDCLQRPHECVDQKLLAGLRGPLLDFASSSPDQRAEFLLAELRVVTKGPLKIGVAVFESFLKPLGMAGAIDATARKLLMELQQVRHLLVHRRGVVDGGFAQACPWLDYKVGDTVKVDRYQIRRWILAVGLYDLELQRRNYVRAGLDVPVRIKEGMDEIVKRLTQT